MPRSYQQHCALARALDVVGERWTLLIVRELLVGPRRFRDLQDNLRGIGPNLLSNRLKELAGHGLVRKRALPEPAADVQVYALTPFGEALAPAVFALTRWGLALLEGPRQGEFSRPEWDLVALRALFREEAARGQWLRANLHVAGDTVFHLEIADGRLEASLAQGKEADLDIHGPVAVLAALAAGELTEEEALARGEMKVRGRKADLDRLLGWFGAATFEPSMAGV